MVDSRIKNRKLNGVTPDEIQVGARKKGCNEMKCSCCGKKWNLSAENLYYYRKGGLIIKGELVKCRNCIEKEISFTTEPYTRVLPSPAFGLDAMFSPRIADIVIRILPVADSDIVN